MISVEKCLELLPNRYHKEFIDDVLIDKESLNSLKKVFIYYIQDIYDELTDSEKEKFELEYIMIKKENYEMEQNEIHKNISLNEMNDIVEMENKCLDFEKEELL